MPGMETLDCFALPTCGTCAVVFIDTLVDLFFHPLEEKDLKFILVFLKLGPHGLAHNRFSVT